MRVIDALSRLHPQEGRFGIEIEVEGSNLAIPYHNRYWKQEQDGSLRPRPECIEYVFLRPLSFRDSITALGWLNAQHRNNESQLNWSFRCSTHVHLNVQEMEVSHLFRLVYLYYIFENLLVKWSGEEREGNRFCLRLADSAEIPIQISNIFQGGLRFIEENQIRYSALNLASLRKYGSIEFRSLNGTTDRERITKWLTIINKLDEYSAKAKDIETLFKEATENLNEMGSRVFGEALFKELYFSGWEYSSLYNISLCINFFETYNEVLQNDANYREQLQQRQREHEAFERIHQEIARAQEQRKPAEAPRKRRGVELGQEEFLRAFAQAGHQ